MVVILVEPAGALLKRSLELRGNTLEPYSCEVLASYAARKLHEMGCSVRVTCIDPKKDCPEWRPAPFADQSGHSVCIHVLQHGREMVEDYDLATTLVGVLHQGTPPYVVGFSVRTYAFRKAVTLAALIRASEPNAKIIMGGYHPSISCDGSEASGNWKDCQPLASIVDYQVVGEGEKPLAALLAKLIQDPPIPAETIRKTLWQDSCEQPDRSLLDSGKPIVLGCGEEWRLTPDEFEAAPSPVRSSDLLNTWCRNWNLSYPSPSRQTGVFQIQFSRGCSHSACSFCCTPYVFGGKDKVRYKSAATLCVEIKVIKESGCNFVYFNDVTFNGNGERWKGLCRTLIRSKLHTPHGVARDGVTGGQLLRWIVTDDDAAIRSWVSAAASKLAAESEARLDATGENVNENVHWFALCRAETISLEDAVLLASAGCSKVGIGVESFCQTVAGSLKKVTTSNYPEAVRTSLKNTDRVGIINRVYIILGSPQETIASLTATWKMLQDLPVDQVRVAFYVPYVTGDELLPGVERMSLSEDAPNIRVPQLQEELDGPAASADQAVPPVKAAYEALAEHPGGERLRRFLLAFRKSLIESFYTSDAYQERARDKVRRYPHLKQSYEEFFVELFETSAARINLIGVLDKKGVER